MSSPHKELQIEISFLERQLEISLQRVTQIRELIAYNKKLLQESVCPHEHVTVTEDDRSRWHNPEWYRVTTCDLCGKELKAERI